MLDQQQDVRPDKARPQMLPKRLDGRLLIAG
jgi:hypothetical protein